MGKVMLLLSLPALLAAGRVRAQVGMGLSENDRDLFYLEEEGEGSDDLFGDATPTKEAAPRSILLEPAGLAVMPVLSYGLGVAHELAPLLGPGAGDYSLRVRYARGSATMGQIYAVTELSTVELLWAFHPWLYLGGGAAYRNVRASLKTDDPGTGSSSASVTGATFVFGLVRPLGSYLLGCDVVGVVLPAGKARRRGPRPTDLDDRNPHVETLDEASEGRSVSLVRLSFGPRF